MTPETGRKSGAGGGTGGGGTVGGGGIGWARRELLAGLAVGSRRYMAAHTLLNQSVADHLGLHPTDLQCLVLLALEETPVTIGRIAALTGLTTGSATRLVDRLERAGYATRARDAFDRRRVLVAAAPERMVEVQSVWQRLSGEWSELYEGYDDEQLALLIAYMRRSTETAVQQTALVRDLAGGAGG